MRYLSKSIRTVFILALLLIGLWALSGSVGPGAESFAHLRAQQAPGAAGSSVSSDAPDDVRFISTLTINPVKLSSPMDAPHEPVDSQYDKWLRGEIDLDMDLRAGGPEIQALQEAAMDLPANRNVFNPFWSEISAPALVTSFDVSDIDDCCGGGGGVVPPDSDMAAGPNHIAVVYNLAMSAYLKDGTPVFEGAAFDSWVGTANADCLGAFDPAIMFDEEVGKWIISLDGGGTHSCLLFSWTDDPSGFYWLYAVPADNGGTEFFDYPHIGIGDHAVFVGSNQFNGGFAGGQIIACDKNQGYAGAIPMTCRTFNVGVGAGTPQPLHLTGWAQGTVPGYVSKHHAFVTDPFDGSTLSLWKWSDALGAGVPTWVKDFNQVALTGVPAGFPVSWPQSGGSTLEANDWRQRGFEFRNGYGWTTDSISCNPGKGTVDCVRWAQIKLAPPFNYVQGGVIGSKGVYRVFPDLAVNHCNDMAIGYSGGAASKFPSIAYTGRRSTDPLGTVQNEKILKWGEETYVSFDGAPLRWGDYSGMAIDPDGITFWFIGEYAKAGTTNLTINWGQYVGSFQYKCSTP